MTTDPTPTLEHHRALANPTRVRILELVQDAAEGIDAATVAQRLGIHVSTARAHLDLLERAALVLSELEERHQRGRPRRLYHPREYPTRTDGPDSYQELARILAASLNNPEGVRTAEALGVQWGLTAIDGPPPAVRSSTREEVQRRLVAMLDGFGFSPTPRTDGHIELGACPFVEVANEHPDVVCGLHRGALNGAAEALGFSGQVALDPFTTADTCRVRLS